PRSRPSKSIGSRHAAAPSRDAIRPRRQAVRYFVLCRKTNPTRKTRFADQGTIPPVGGNQPITSRLRPRNIFPPKSKAGFTQAAKYSPANVPTRIKGPFFCIASSREKDHGSQRPVWAARNFVRSARENQRGNKLLPVEKGVRRKPPQRRT